jgi:hypothetical protein
MMKYLMALSLLFCTGVQAQQTTLPWLQQIAPGVDIANIHTVSTRADVKVSDGLTYSTKTIYRDPQRAIFHRTYVDRTAVQGVEGACVWGYDGTKEMEAPAYVGGFVLGHQFHAQLLFFDRLHASLGSPEEASLKGKACFSIASKNESFNYKAYYRKDGMPLGMEIIREGEANILYEFSDWREVEGLRLPFDVRIDDGDRIFEYSFEEVKLNQGSLAEYRAPDSVLTDEQRLLRCHRVIMDGHLFGQTAGMKAQQADSLTILSDGDIFKVPGNQPASMIDKIMASRDYTVYDDLVRPQVQVSDDGTLAWLTARIHAKGFRFDETGNPTIPLEFTCSWIELYKKVGEDWKMTGIVSTFPPEK